MNPVQQAQRLIATGRAADALDLLAPLAAADVPAHAILAKQADALKLLGRPEEALAVQRRTVELYPASGIAWHNLATDLADLRRGTEARSTASQALQLGLDAPETWYVLGNACVLLADLDEAERAYRQALRRRPAYWQAAFALTRLTWMRTGDPDAALEPARAARQAGRLEPMLVLVEAKILECAGQADEAESVLRQALSITPGDPHFLHALSLLAFDRGELDAASRLMEQALAKLPADAKLLGCLVSIRLAQGRGDEALSLARRATETSPLDQSTWGWLATAARAVGDPAHAQLCDYPSFVRSYRIETPAGWPSLEAYLADLSTALRRLHIFDVAPADQSLRHGAQTPGDLTACDDPVVQTFFRAIDAPIRRYMVEVGRGSDPLRSRNTGDYQVSAAWSVLLKPNGFHIDHFHPEGWLSSAFYVEVPAAALDANERQGWIKFGQAPSPTVPPQPPEYFVRPEPGLLVLFPSYLWHGTIPFTSDESRMTIAFDLLSK